MPDTAAVFGPGHAEAGRCDRRLSLRHAVNPDLNGHLIAAIGESFWPARVIDISARGIGLRARRGFPVGSSVLIELANGARIFSCALSMRIVRVEEEPDGSFILGAEFARPLSQRELMALLS